MIPWPGPAEESTPAPALDPAAMQWKRMVEILEWPGSEDELLAALEGLYESHSR
jgi:hypothetical protein